VHSSKSSRKRLIEFRSKRVREGNNAAAVRSKCSILAEPFAIRLALSSPRRRRQLQQFSLCKFRLSKHIWRIEWDAHSPYSWLASKSSAQLDLQHNRQVFQLLSCATSNSNLMHSSYRIVK
jgi:hypothetical protein